MTADVTPQTPLAEPDTGRAAEVARLLHLFRDTGARQVEPGYLQPAETLLDLYGEEIRARAYRTDDPLHGEQMLRPDFTVPILETHFRAPAQPARYCYAGPVWRRQGPGAREPREFWQVGIEHLGSTAPEADVDADLLALFASAIGRRAAPKIADAGLLRAALLGLDTSDARKRALLRQLWNKARFLALVDRYAAPAAPRALPEDPLDAIRRAGQFIGRRSAEEVAARLGALAEDAATAPLAGDAAQMLHALATFRGTAEAALDMVSARTATHPGLGPARDRFAARLDALAARGLDVASLGYDAQIGAAGMEYYDGFLFVFDAPDGTRIASGGRYDALANALATRNAQNGMSAVGGVIRPGSLARLA